MAKRIAFHDKARHSLKDGIDVLAGAVKYTLGPRGRNIAIDNRFGIPTVTISWECFFAWQFVGVLWSLGETSTLVATRFGER